MKTDARRKIGNTEVPTNFREVQAPLQSMVHTHQGCVRVHPVGPRPSRTGLGSRCENTDSIVSGLSPQAFWEVEEPLRHGLKSRDHLIVRRIVEHDHVASQKPEVRAYSCGLRHVEGICVSAADIQFFSRRCPLYSFNCAPKVEDGTKITRAQQVSNTLNGAFHLFASFYLGCRLR